MAKIVVRLPEPKEEYDVSNQKQINRAIAFEAIALSLNKLNTAEAAFVKVKVTVVPDPASSETKILLIIALESDGAVYTVVLSVVDKSTFAFLYILATYKPRKSFLLLFLFI